MDVGQGKESPSDHDIRNRKVPSKFNRLDYFFLDGALHKKIRIVRNADLIYAWHFREKRVISYVWSVTKKRRQKAYTIRDTANLLNRNYFRLFTLITSGEKFPIPERSYKIDNPEKDGPYFLSEDDIYRVHDYLMTVHYGAPRKDGTITPVKTLPSRAELRAKIKNDPLLYVKNKNGEFVPVFKEIDW